MNGPTTEQATANQPIGVLWQVLAGGLLFRSVIAYFLPVGFDEAYYFLYTQHLDWSYFDHPPAVAWSAGIGLWLTGIVTPFTLRLGALGLFTGCLWLLYATAKQLFGSRVGFLSCAIASLTPLFFLSFGILAAPDNTLMFFWGLALYLCSYEFFPADQQAYAYRPTSRLVWICFIVGLACLGKYHGFVLGLGLVLFCLAHRQYRAALTSKWLLVGAVAFAITVLPIFYWNAQHDWISFRFQLGDRFTQYQLDPNALEPHSYSLGALLGVIGAQAGYLFPSIALPLWWVTLKTAFHTFANLRLQRPEHRTTTAQVRQEKINFLLWTGLPVAIAFTLIGGAAHTFPAWPAPGLWSLIILLGHAAARWPHHKVSRWLKTTGWIVGTVLIFTLTHIRLGTLQKPGDYAILGGIVTVEADPSTQLIDVVQLQQRLAASDEFSGAIAQSDFVATREYWRSGYFAMAMPQSNTKASTIPVISLTIDPRGHAFWFNPQNWIGKNALLMSIASTSQTEFLSEMAPYFESITPLTAIATQRGGENSEIFYLYQAKKLIKAYPDPYPVTATR
ncbi:MAG: ArnT family glycosyltransferase [Phormidesmis sp.]